MTAVRSEILHTCNTLKQEANDIISFYRLLQGEEPFAGKFISAGKSIKKQITAIRKLTEPLIVDGPAIIKAAEPIRSKISEINASDATKAKVITIWTNHTGRILGELGTMERLLQLPQVPALPPPSKPQEIHRLFEELDLQLLEMLNIIQEKRPTLSVTDAVFAINQIKNELLKIQDTLAAPTEFNISTCRVIIIELAKKIGSLPFQGIHISAFISHLKQLDAQLAQLKPRSVIPPKKSKIVLTKSQLYLLFAKVIGEPVPLSPLYRNNLKNRNFGKEGPQKLISERVTIADRQGASEKSIFEVTPTQPETDSSGYFGIDPLSKFQSILSSLIKQVAALKKEYRLAGSLEELESQLFQIQSYLQLVAVPLSTLSVQISTLMHRIFKLDVRSIKWRRLANLVGTDLHNLNKAVKQRLPKKALSQRQSLLDNELRTGKIQFSIQDIIHPFIQQAKTHLHFLYGFFNTQPNVLVLKKQLDLPAIALLQMQMTDPSQLLPNLRAAIAYISTLSLEGEIAPLVQYHWLVHTEEIMEYLTAAELVVAVFERENEVEDEARTDASHAISGEGIRTPVQTRILQLCPQITNEASEISKYFNAMIEMEIFVPVATEEANQIHTVVAAITPLIGNLSSANIKAIRSMVSKAIERISGTNPPKNYTSRLVWQEHTKKIRSRLEEIDQILARQTLVLPVSNHRSPSPLPLSPPPKPKDSSKTKRKRKLDPPAETATAPSTSSFASPFEGIIQSSLSQIDAFLKPHDFLAA